MLPKIPKTQSFPPCNSRVVLFLPCDKRGRGNLEQLVSCPRSHRKWKRPHLNPTHADPSQSPNHFPSGSCTTFRNGWCRSGVGRAGWGRLKPQNVQTRERCGHALRCTDAPTVLCPYSFPQTLPDISRLSTDIIIYPISIRV